MSRIKIMVFNVPAETLGALSILNDFYNEIRKIEDKSISWIFVLSKPKLEETENIKVLNFHWIKKSWFHRLYFDHVVAPKLVKKFKVDKILSFQNVTIPHTNVEQILYMHNSLPFVDYKFTFKENKHLWIYQNIIGRNIVNSIKRADKVIVQTEWIKKACIERTKILEDKISIIPPSVTIIIDKFFKPEKEAFNTFFYPSSGFEYKNHIIIIEACKKLKFSNITNYKIIFTLTGKENDYTKRLLKETLDNKLPIEFVGKISRERVFDLYTKSVLLFPSYIETFGLPILEARLHKGVVLASDCPFSHEILSSYKNAYFFDPFDVDKLVELMDIVLNNKIKYVEKCNQVTQSSNVSWSEIINNLIKKGGD